MLERMLCVALINKVLDLQRMSTNRAKIKCMWIEVIPFPLPA